MATFGTNLFFITNNEYIKFATPAVPSVWPIFALIAPKYNGLFMFLFCPYTFVILFTSIGSPNFVPVPCVAINVISSGLMFVCFKTSKYKFCWEIPFGAVITALFPSWLTEIPSITPHI